MRVVFLTHNYPRRAGDIAGTFLHPLARVLREHGVDVRVVAPSDRGEGGRELLDGVPVRRVRYAAPERETLAYTGTMLDAARSPRGLLTFRRLTQALQAGARAELEGATDAVVHAHWWVPGGMAAPASIPMVLTCHGTDIRLLDRLPLLSLLAKPVFRRARVVTTVSRALATVVKARTGITVLPDDILPMPIVALERPASRGGNGLLVLGRLTDQKRVHLAIEAFAVMRSRGYQGTLTVVGEGNAREALRALVRARHLDEAVLFVGGVPPARVPDYLATADAVLMPALAEGLGLAAVEALMQGVPVVVCRDGGGLLDVVPADGGGRIAAPDADALASATLDLLADAGARASAQAIGDILRQRLAPEHVAARCIDWYRRALQ